MRLSTKIAAACSMVVVLLLLVQGGMHNARFTDFHQRELEDDLVMLASTLANAAEHLSESGATDTEVREYLRSADESRTRADIDLQRRLDLDDPATRPRTAANDREVLVGTVDEGVAAQASFDSGSGERWLTVWRSGVEHDAFQTELLQRQVAMLGLLTLIAGLAGWLIARRMIERPVAEMMEHIDRVSAGDYSVPIRPASNDELGLLQGTLDALSVRLEEANAQLKARRRESNQLQSRLRHADRLSTVGKLASGLAHELGTPLNVVKGRAQLIARANRDNPSVLKSAQVIVSETERMSGLISELLSFARRSPRSYAPTRPGQLLEQAATFMELMAEDARVRIVVADEASATAELDAQKVLQVLTNLMTNAIHAMPKGGRLTVGVRDQTITEPPNPRHSPGRYLEFWVADTGVGMDPETLSHVLEPFFTTKKEGKGTGLGLSVCDGIIQEHGGWLELSSTPGKGSRFNFFIPAMRRSAEDSQVRDVT